MLKRKNKIAKATLDSHSIWNKPVDTLEEAIAFGSYVHAYFDSFKVVGNLTNRQAKTVDGIYDQMIGQLLNEDYDFSEDQGLFDPISMEDSLPVLNEVWLNPKYHQLIIDKIIAEDLDDPGNWSNVYDEIYSAIN